MLRKKFIWHRAQSPVEGEGWERVKNGGCGIDSVCDRWFHIISVVSKPPFYSEMVIHDSGISIVVVCGKRGHHTSQLVASIPQYLEVYEFFSRCIHIVIKNIPWRFRAERGKDEQNALCIGLHMLLSLLKYLTLPEWEDLFSLFGFEWNARAAWESNSQVL